MKDSSTTIRPWWWAIGFLVGLPLLLATSLRFWIGVPTEVAESGDLFGRLGITGVEVVDANSLQFGKMFFSRFQVEPDSLASFVQQLKGFERTQGLPKKPTILKLDRPWWDPDTKTEGTTWKLDLVTIWSPQDHPDVFYAVVEGEAAGVEVEDAKSAK